MLHLIAGNRTEHLLHFTDDMDYTDDRWEITENMRRGRLMASLDTTSRE